MASQISHSRTDGAGLRGAPDAETFQDWLEVLTASGAADVSDEERVDQLRSLEELKAAAAAAQARITVELDASQRSAQAAAGVRAVHQGRGVASQVALARRDSPFKGSRHLGFAKGLVLEMPHTLALLARGVLSEWRATLLVRETACLSAEDRATVDRVLCADPAWLEGLGDNQIVAEAKKLTYRLDPASVVRRVRKAESERRVSIRPAPDTMTYVTGLVPMTQGVAVHAALKKVADSLIATGDGRPRGQIMADLFVERLTGQSEASAVPVTVNLVMTDQSLLGTDTEPVHVQGYGPVPAWLGRRLLAHATATGSAWIRRLYTTPASGELVAMESRARRFPTGLASFIDVRDLGICRTPWCDAPIRHGDHIEAVEDGGATTGPNGQGLCEQCNHAKQAPGWQAKPRPGPRHTVVTTTPTGHSYRSTAPPLPGTPHEQRPRSRLEAHFNDLVLAS